jgi:hypothetical protein
MIEGVDNLLLDPSPEAEAPSIRADVMHMEGSNPQPTSNQTGILRTSTVSFDGISLQIRPRLDGSLAGPRPL